MTVPKEKEEELKKGEDESRELYKYYYKGFFSDAEKHRNVVEIRSKVKANIEKILKGMT